MFVSIIDYQSSCQISTVSRGLYKSIVPKPTNSREENTDTSIPVIHWIINLSFHEFSFSNSGISDGGLAFCRHTVEPVLSGHSKIDKT